MDGVGRFPGSPPLRGVVDGVGRFPGSPPLTDSLVHQ